VRGQAPLAKLPSFLGEMATRKSGVLVWEWRFIQEEGPGGAVGAGGEVFNRGVAVLAVSVLGKGS
jgi:hypothetical protein